MSHRNIGIRGMTREVTEVQDWVSTVMEAPWEGTFEEYLKDGQVRTRARHHTAPQHAAPRRAPRTQYGTMHGA